MTKNVFVKRHKLLVEYVITLICISNGVIVKMQNKLEKEGIICLLSMQNR